MRVERDDTALTAGVPVGTELAIPINHFEGNYTCDAATLAELRAEDRVVLRYVDNPNGSVDDIAGVCNAGRNVVGLMPHPERASDPLLGSEDGGAAAAAAAPLGCARPARAGRAEPPVAPDGDRDGPDGRSDGPSTPGAASRARRPAAARPGAGGSWPAGAPTALTPDGRARPSRRCPCARRTGGPP